MTTLRVTMIDGQPAVLLPPEVAERLAVTDGAEIAAVETAVGYELTNDAERARQLEVARGVMRDDRDALGELAK